MTEWTSDHLQRALDLLEANAWGKGTSRCVELRDLAEARGQTLRPSAINTRDEVTAYCAYGAIRDAHDPHPQAHGGEITDGPSLCAVNVLAALLPPLHDEEQRSTQGYSIPVIMARRVAVWNDNPHRRWPEVRDLFVQAIAEQRQREAQS